MFPLHARLEFFISPLLFSFREIGVRAAPSLIITFRDSVCVGLGLGLGGGMPREESKDCQGRGSAVAANDGWTVVLKR